MTLDCDHGGTRGCRPLACCRARPMAAAATTAGAGRRLNLKPSHVHVRLGQAPLGQIYRSDLEQGHN
jgi:hypothetical protein